MLCIIILLYTIYLIFCQDFQDRAIKITKSTERLVSSGHFAGEQATEQAYAILSVAADYVNDLDQHNTLLNRAMIFFDLARSVNIFKFLLYLYVEFNYQLNSIALHNFIKLRLSIGA